LRIGVIGGGTVGRATARAFLEHADVRVYDVCPERSTHSQEEALDTDLVFVCLPTPAGPGGWTDLYEVEKFFGSVRGTDTNFALRSTVPVGTTKRLRTILDLPNLCHSPEFLTARCSTVDAQMPARNIVGWISAHTAHPLMDLYERRFPGVPIHLMTSDESEMVKLATNAFFATKVAFFNEARSLADAAGLDWNRVLAAVLADGRIAHSHTNVPGPDGQFGFGGACLPKDAASFAACLNDRGLRADVTRAALARNAADRRRDAEEEAA
jgi:UDPglucose 6-dehydrogenase